MGFSNCFTVPASAFRVDGIIAFLVGFAGPFERGGELVLVYLVVVIDEDVRFCDRVFKVRPRIQLMSMPMKCQRWRWIL